MDCSLNMIDIQLFTPHKLYQRIFNKDTDKTSISDKTTLNEDDVIFYRKRILQMIKDLVKGKQFTREIHDSFNDFTRNAIQYLMFIDKAELIQDSINVKDANDSEKHLSSQLPPIYENDEEHLANKLLFKEQVGPITRKLDTFVVRKNDVKRDTVLPQQKEYNIKEEKYKVKGITSNEKRKKYKKHREKQKVKKENSKIE